ncbi:OmpA family protein [Empedobacter falsenii]|uniref:OmpA family protein n=1 Tax=Empedobacter falsenii TaxID=343874 RepID=UPI001C55C9EC|nr:OmpA family protein [Empedobacter falsenii]MBW1617194.1 OmpA family protein [Empedobacter falsenii]
MKKLLYLLFLSSVTYTSAQNSQNDLSKEREFNSWSVSVFGGGNLIQNSDLVSFDGGYLTPGFDFQFQVNKQLTHAFGVSAQFQLGETRQKGTIYDNTPWGNAYSGKVRGITQYHGVSLLADINASNLLRRTDSKHEFKWAVHLYGGVGILGYKAKRNNWYGSGNNYEVVTDQKMDEKSVYSQVGAGLRYKLNSKFDFELRAMYVLTGDEDFDGSGKPEPGYWTAADTQPDRNDNMITLSFGLHYKIGKHKEAVQWVSPLYRQPLVPNAFECIDEDNDGVCDQWDKCPGTPEGVKVDGAGCPLDSDGDGIPDSEDKCPTIPGPPTNGGCPEKVVRISGDEVATTINAYLEGIEFDYDSDRIREQSYEKLNHAAEVLLANPDFKFMVEGHTDAAGGVDYNQKLSERRAASVVRYLANKGVDTTKLSSVGRGKSDLKWAECNPVTNCPAWKNLENRRVVFKEIK